MLWDCTNRADNSLHQAVRGHFGRIQRAARSPTFDDLPGSYHHLPCQGGLSTFLVTDTQAVELRQPHLKMVNCKRIPL